MLVCSECKGKNIHIIAWVDANTLEFRDDGPNDDENDRWCVDCKDHTAFETTIPVFTDRLEAISFLMELRKDWTYEDFYESYSDEWHAVPKNLKVCRIQMEETITLTYELDYINECIENEMV